MSTFRLVLIVAGSLAAAFVFGVVLGHWLFSDVSA